MEGENTGTVSPGQGLWAENKGLAPALCGALGTDTIHSNPKATSCTPTGGESTAWGRGQAAIDTQHKAIILISAFSISASAPAGGRKQRESDLPRLSQTLEKATTLRDYKEDKGFSTCSGGKARGLGSTREVLIDPEV